MYDVPVCNVRLLVVAIYFEVYEVLLTRPYNKYIQPGNIYPLVFNRTENKMKWTKK